jgi:hypothetical protein
VIITENQYHTRGRGSRNILGFLPSTVAATDETFKKALNQRKSNTNKKAGTVKRQTRRSGVSADRRISSEI